MGLLAPTPLLSVTLFLCVTAVKFLEDEFKAEVVSINIPELEVCVNSFNF